MVEVLPALEFETVCWGKAMGYGISSFAVLKMLAIDGSLSDIKQVVDLGAQEIHMSEGDQISHPFRTIIRELCLTLGGPDLSSEEVDSLAARASAGDLFERLNIRYKSLDTNAWYGEPFDLNFDKVSDEDRGAYCLTMNAGTTEHLFDQENAFRVAHDLTRVGGLMIHSVPFVGNIDHGLFNYNPNLFSQLALQNSYELLGMWVTGHGEELFEWNEHSARHFSYLGYICSPNNGGGLFLTCVLRKVHAGDFCIPFQASYEHMVEIGALERYQVNFDGKMISAAEMRQIHEKENLRYLSGRALMRELGKRFMRRISLR